MYLLAAGKSSQPTARSAARYNLAAGSLPVCMIHSAASQYNAGVSTEVHPAPDEQNVSEYMPQDTDNMHGPC